ncbi:MAG TPA: DUF362 domain-containing protein [Alphaproteobacteria bacterium]|jgi:hypothetical protein|nr:DUF362 domain-containing protein [Alphaproteobacteria bacterium]MDP6269843.1 DUF362 domain-containing protein [Alphaproteobacteria bacterium]MDP7426602.1 DUF362 domain-containing protein [Alphaproteobacteria bacterium]HJM52280.1 DUF362 domain-containing protein [Alphaproteobacteria bacterium]
MIPSSIPIPLPGGLDVELPPFFKVRQKFSAEEMADMEKGIATDFKKAVTVDLAGKSVAIGLGSRGIRTQPPVVKAVIAELKAAGAVPFIAPTMGSHAGGTAEGQQKILESYGLGEADLGVPIRSSMEVVEVARLDDGTPVYCDKICSQADYIVVCNRVKPHTDFRAVHESGLIKMMAIGLAKHAGAEALHRHGMERFDEMVPAAGRAFLANTNVLFGVAIVENAFDRLLTAEIVAPDEIFERDAALLEIAKANIPRFLFEGIDVLVIDQIGKDISGAGMDPNATGRPSWPVPNFYNGPHIKRIVVRDLTEATHGNATGISGADVTTQRVVRQMDWTATYVNIVTAGVIQAGKLPMVADNDRMAIAMALRGCPMLEPEDARIVRVRNTLELDQVWVSEPMAAEVERNPELERLSDAVPVRFDADETFLPFE